MGWTRGLIAVLTLAVVATYVYFHAETPSPGPIAAVHAQEPDLLGGAGCDACHGDEGTPMVEACASCHADIGAQLQQEVGFHGKLAEARQCGWCHFEHQGREFDIVGRRGFALAGVADPMAYRHEGLDYELGGKHVELACKDCHDAAEAEVLQKGTKRFLGESQDCASCHDDPHEGRLPDCASCHGQSEPFATVASFVHDERFPLAGAHAGLACRDCHARDSASSLERLRGAAAPGGDTRLAVRACADCHDSPHAEPFLAGVVRALGPAAGCDHCHEAAGAGFARPLAAMDRELHAASGFPLVEPHAELRCEQCHDDGVRGAAGEGGGEAFARLYPGRRADDCRACHGDPHGGEFDEGAFAGRSCIHCHDRRAFQPPAFTPEMHARTRFPLTGAHAAVGCDACHESAAHAAAKPAVARVFRGASRECAGCHEDVHDGMFRRADLPKELRAEEGCARCHGTASFAKVERERFDHGAWTVFPLRGGHAKASCEQCHPRAGGKGALRTFGRAKQGCADCHSDPHAGQFRERDGTDCWRCHGGGGSFDELTFDHGRDARFALDEQHEKLACSVCHKSYPLPGGGAVIRYRPLGIRCIDCHGATPLAPASTGTRFIRGGR